jgi:hypothetical protein
MKMSEVDERSGGIYAVNSVMEARSDIVHNGLTVKDAHEASPS